MRFAQPLERGRLVRRYKRFLADIVTDEGEAMCIHCPNTGSMLNCMSEGARDEAGVTSASVSREVSVS